MGSAPGATAPARNLLQCGCPRAAASFWAYSPAPAWGFPQAAACVSVLTWSSPCYSMTACFTVVFSMGCRGISYPALECLFPLLLLSLGCFQGFFSHIIFLTLHCRAAFCPFLNILSQKLHHLGCRAQPCPVVGPLESAAIVGVQHGAALSSPHGGHPEASPTNTLLLTPNTPAKGKGPGMNRCILCVSAWLRGAVRALALMGLGL